jgi:hypothetical protein
LSKSSPNSAWTREKRKADIIHLLIS